MADANGGTQPIEEATAERERWPSLRAAALDILGRRCPYAKARGTAAAAALWFAGELPIVAPCRGAGGSGGESDDAPWLPVPDAPGRPEGVVVPKGHVKSGSMRSMLHGVCHAESYAIDLMWDSVARFADGDGEGGPPPPRDFFEEWVGIARDEARHFRGWADHLERRYATRYGDLPTHDMLWEVARETRHSLRARLAVVHLIHEARGLDVAETMRAKCLRAQDSEAASMLDKNIADEVGHVAAGARWFRHLCRESAGGDLGGPDGDGEEAAAAEFLRLARAHYYGELKRPFNTELRREAGLPESWYLPLAEPEVSGGKLRGGGGKDHRAAEG